MKRHYKSIIILVFMIAGIFGGIYIGRVIWLWFHIPGQVEVWRNLSNGAITRTVDTSSNFLWDVVFGWLGLCGGFMAGGLVNAFVLGKITGQHRG